MLYKFSNRIYYTKHRFTRLEPAIGYIKGDNFSIMIDTGNSKEQVELFFQELENENLPLPTYSVLTHYHWDHSFGAFYTNTSTISTLKTSEYLKKLANYKWDDESINNRISEKKETRYSAEIFKKIYTNEDSIKIKIPEIIKYGDFTLNLGGIIVYFYYNDNSHSDDSLLIYIKDEKVLFIGDSHSKSYETVPLSFNKEKLFAYIQTLNKIDFEYAIPGHGNILTKRELIEILEKEYSEI